MGSGTSKIETTATYSEKMPRESMDNVMDEKADAELVKYGDLLKNLTIQDSGNGEIGVSHHVLSSWESAFQKDPKNVLAQNALAGHSMYKVFANKSNAVTLGERYFFNLEVKHIGDHAYFDSQLNSGRCWIFATCNVLRSQVIKKYNLKSDGFQLSQSYLYFYDKLERSNYALDTILDTYDLPLDSRYLNFVLKDPVGDGGQWDLVVNLLDKYGAVPNEVFPDNFQSGHTAEMNYILKEKIREFALILRKLKLDGASDSTIANTKSSMLKEIYNVISIALGTPPKPTDNVVWEYKDKDGNYKRVETNPVDFYKEQIGHDCAKYFSLIHDPRNDSGKLYTVERLNNMVGGRNARYVNTSLESMKRTAIKMIKADEPVFFGCDVGKFYDQQTGILDVDQYNFQLGFGTGLNMSKLERLKTVSSVMTHAMAIAGVHLDPNGKPLRWKIQNSWGPDVGDKGYYMMTDKWFDEFVFQIVTSKTYASKEDYSVLKGGQYNVLPFYDPMGALASV